MKFKIIFSAILALCLAVAPVQGQVYSMLATTGNATDTVVNTSAETLTKQISGSYGEVTVQVLVTKISGTVAGTVLIYGSLDGTTYTRLNNLGQPSANDTCTNTDVATQSWIWALGTSKYLYYRVTVTGSGTMTARVAAKIMVRKSG